MAIGPIDYTLNVQSPFQAAAQGLQLGSAIQALPGQQEAQRLALEQSQREGQRQQLLQTEVERISQMENPTLDDYNKLIMYAPPQQIAAINQHFESKGEEYTRGVLKRSGQVISSLQAGKPDIAKSILSEQAQASRNSGDEASAKFYDDAMAAIDENPEAAKRQAIVQALTVPDGFKFLQGIRALEGGPGMGAGAHSVRILPGGYQLIVTKDNETIFKDVQGRILSGDEARDAMKEADRLEIEQARGKRTAETEAELTARAELGGRVTSAEEKGRIGAKETKEATNSLTKIRVNLNNLNEAKELLKKGAVTGKFFEKFPDFSDTTIALKNIQNKLGLDVIGQTTFGTLTGPELKLAMQTGLNTDLSSPALIKEIERYEKVQKKLIKEIDDFIDYSAKNPGKTQADWQATKREELRNNGGVTEKVQTIKARPYSQFLGGQ